MSYYSNQTSNYYRPSLFGGFKFFPPVIKSLLISNVAVFFLASFFGLFRISGVPFSSVISYIFALYPIDNGFQFYQLVTYMFMHGGLFHLFFNMFALWMFGIELENQWGSRKFLIYYFSCGIGAGLTTLFVGPLFGPAAPTVGASGAVYGVLIAFGVIYPDRPIFVYFLLPIRARYFVMLYILLELYAGVTGTSDGIAHFAHLGGAAIGYIFILIDRKTVSARGVWNKTRQKFAVPGTINAGDSDYRSDITDAKYSEYYDENEEKTTQYKIDIILDKISQKGYQSLTEEEKKILFEASKKLN